MIYVADHRPEKSSDEHTELILWFYLFADRIISDAKLVYIFWITYLHVSALYLPHSSHGKKFEEKPHQDAVFKPSNISVIVATRKSDRLLGEKSPSVTAVSEAAVSSGFFTPNKRSDYRGSIIP